METGGIKEHLHYTDTGHENQEIRLEEASVAIDSSDPKSAPSSIEKISSDIVWLELILKCWRYGVVLMAF